MNSTEYLIATADIGLKAEMIPSSARWNVSGSNFGELFRPIEAVLNIPCYLHSFPNLRTYVRM